MESWSNNSMSGMVNIMFGIRQDKNFQDFYDVISKEYTDDVDVKDIMVEPINGTPFCKINYTKEWTIHLLKQCIDYRLSGKTEMVEPYYSTEGKRRKVDIGDINMLEWKGRSDFVEHIGKRYREHFVPHTKLKEMQKTTAWINWQTKGDYLPVHSHKEVLSCTSYLMTPIGIYQGPVEKDCPLSGGLDLMMEDQRVLHVRPVPGTGIVFPGHTPHVVYPFVDEGIRININSQLEIKKTDDDYNIREDKRRAVDNFFKAVNKPGASPRDEPEGPRDDKMRTILQRIKRVDD